MNAPARRPHPVALPANTSAFRLPGSGGDPYWVGDDMGGAVDPSGPNLSRRDFLIRAAVAATSVVAGGAINVLTTTLARQSAGASGSGRR